LWRVRLTDFWSRMTAVFGAGYAESFARDFVLAELGGRTVVAALDAGEDPKFVWRAVCEAKDVPAAQR
jgi:hypothetical protein